MSHPPANWDTDAFAERIVREVIRRLLAMEAQGAGSHRSPGAAAGAFAHRVAAAPHRISEKLVTAATLESIPTGTTELILPSRTVVTPLARDEAKAKGIRLTRSEQSQPPNPGTPR